MQQKGRKLNMKKGPKSWKANKTPKKGGPPRGKGTNHILDLPPLTIEASKGNV